MASIQLDTYSELARLVVPRMLAIKLPTRYYQQGQGVLRKWNFHMAADSAAAAYFNVFWRNLLRLTFDDQLPEQTWPTGGSRWWVVMLQLLKQPDNKFWDNVNTPKRRETRDDIIRQAMVDARDELTSTMSRNPHDWRWGALHQLQLRNSTLGSSSSPLAFLFNRGGYDVGGGPSIVDANSWDASKDNYDVTVAPSMRMIIPMNDLNAARWIDLTGESGHAFDSHYTDQTNLWVDGKTLPWLFSKPAVEKAAADVLTLKPRHTS
ncbi:MAG: penicillin acylase family protein, partial [Nocardioidaceae bacterium]